MTRSARQIVPLALLALSLGCADRERPAGAVEGGRRQRAEDRAIRADDAQSRILFGDLHVHSTYSVDAFIYSLPLFGGEGAHPPADACDYARYCSGLDFYSNTDHAEGLTPEKWRRIKDVTRQCNEVAGDPADPDLVAFIGWEWTQAGATPETHYGHKNVIFRGLAEDEVPARVINSLPRGTANRAPPDLLLQLAQGLLGAFGQGEYADFLWSIRKMAQVPECAADVHTRELPAECTENAPTPAALFEKLRQWDFDTLVIPHGLAWGIHAPPGANLDVQLDGANHDPDRQRLLEVSSGHGNSEEYRPWRAVEWEDGERICPEPTDDFLPCCWRAGEIIRERCQGLPAAECEARVVEARQLALDAGVTPFRVIPDSTPEDWLDCGQCRDCFKPAYGLRPRQSAQYALATGNFEESADEPLRYRFGFISSSDDHKAQPGTGYKQKLRKKNTDARGFPDRATEERFGSFARGEQEDPQRAQPEPQQEQRDFRALFDAERVASFMVPGGLVAVHSEGRDRDSIWRALESRAVYGTSGPRILLWFDLSNAANGRAPMGSAMSFAGVPRFEVRALGAFVQRPGCPEDSRSALSAERLERLCRGECHHPSDQRHPIAAIEVVRIRPQRVAGEDVTPLVEDPWRRFECAPDPQGCRVAFEDPDYPALGRDVVYYARALQEPTPAINGANLRTEFDAEGDPTRVTPCYGGYRTPFEEDCLAPVQERAWSSPIFLDR